MLKYIKVSCVVLIILFMIYLITIYTDMSYHIISVATRYGLDGPEIESLWGARFSAPVQTGPGAHPAPCTMGTGYFSEVKRLERGVDQPLLLTPSLKKE
jgi:hypothetical protein